MSNMNFLIADLIKFVSGTMITFPQGDATNINSHSLAPGLLRGQMRALLRLSGSDTWFPFLLSCLLYSIHEPTTCCHSKIILTGIIVTNNQQVDGKPDDRLRN